MKRLNIFVDETGEFGFSSESSRLYGVSFTFHEQDDSIIEYLNKLNKNLRQIGYSNMIHMADLIMKREDYSHFSIDKRKKIFNSIYQFSRRIPVKYCSVFVDKNFINNKSQLRVNLSQKINNMIRKNEEYFNKFDKIVLYYDNGQETLGIILETTFSIFEGFEHRIEFDHQEKRLFQVSDMLTFIDKYDYKYKNKIPFTNGEKYFFTKDNIRKILKELDKKRFNK